MTAPYKLCQMEKISLIEKLYSSSMGEIRVSGEFYKPNGWISAPLSFHKRHPGVIFSHWPQHGINHHILSISSYYPMNSMPLKHTHTHTLMSSCTGITGRYSGNRRGGGQRWSPLSCWEQTAILLHECWKWTGDEHAECSDKRKKTEHWLTIAAGRRLFPRKWKRGHSATNQTKKSLIAPQAQLFWQLEKDRAR